MERSKLSLKWLEVFQAVARSGSLRDGAAELGISVSTVSHHLSCLDRAVGATLLDHSRRPMRLTVEGETLLRHVDEALTLLRKGVTEMWSDDPQSLVRVLRIAHIEDFDPDVAPALADRLARALPACELSMLSRPSHEIIELLQGEDVDVGIAASTEIDMSGFAESPLLRDPYLLATPLSAEWSAESAADLTELSRRLPFLRYSKKQLIGRRVEAHLRRLDLRLPGRMELESSQSIMAMVAANRGWTVTTALSYACAGRFRQNIRLSRFPGKAFARRISAYRRDSVPPGLHAMIAGILRQAVQTMVVEDTLALQPWLDGQFGLLTPDDPLTAGSETPP